MSSTAVSIVALRLTTNQRSETLLTSTPLVDLAQPPSTTPLVFPQFVDGGGYTMMLMLLNPSERIMSGRLQSFSDDGLPFSFRQIDGTTASSLDYSILPGGLFILETDNSSPEVRAGWTQITPAEGTTAPAAAGVFRFSRGGVVITESGVPVASLATRARIYVDTANGHDTGLALTSPGGGVISLQAFGTDGITPAGTSAGLIVLGPNGHASKFVGQIIPDLEVGFTGVLEISSASPFAVLTVRSLVNARRDFLLTTIPVVPSSHMPSAPLVFPLIVDGGGYKTEILLIGSDDAAVVRLSRFDSEGTQL